MVKPILVVSLAFAALVCGAIAAPTKSSIALSELTAQGSIDASTAVVISDRLRNELFNTNVFTVVERTQMQDILKEQGFQQSGVCSSDACVVEMGQLLGVKYILVGSVAKVGATYTISTRMIDVATGKIVQIASSDCRGEIDDVLLKSTLEIAKKLAKGAEPSPQRSVPENGQTDSRKFQWNKHLKLKVSFGCAAALAFSAGIYYNSIAEKRMDAAAENLATYKSAPNNNDYDTINHAYKDNLDHANSNALLRNIAYGLGAAALTAFSLTWAF